MARLDAATERALLEWIEEHRSSGGPAHARGYQGNVYLYQGHGRRLIVKAASGSGIFGALARRMLRREYFVYQQLDDFAGAPVCYGLLKNRYLILEYVDGIPLRRATVVDRMTFFNTLLASIQELHRRGIAHADLKRKDNLMVIEGRLPCLVDFGAAIVKKPGFAPLNHYLYELARRFDLNAWVKLKYQGRYDQMAPEDRVFFRRTVVEQTARRIKSLYLSIKNRFAH